MRILDGPVRLIALGVARDSAFAEFSHVVQQARIALQSVAIAPLDDQGAPDPRVGIGIGGVSVTIVTHAPERAKILRFEDGSTISDLGISRISYWLTSSPEEPSRYRVPIPSREEVRRDHDGPHWFTRDGVGYLSAIAGERVVVQVHDAQVHDHGGAQLCAVILYRDYEEDRGSTPEEVTGAKEG